MAAGSTPLTGISARVEAKLAERDIGREIVRRQHVHRHQESERDGEVEVATLLLHVGGRQIHDDSFRGQGQSKTGECTAHTLAALGHRLVGKAYDQERR